MAVALAAVAACLTGPSANPADAAPSPRPWGRALFGADPRPVVYHVSLDEPITAVVADYVDRAIGIAEAEVADALLISLDTPGGDSESMLQIGEGLLNADVPVIVWVGPQGARAASAGTFVVLAAHAAGMAPRTTIGAASPVDASGADLPDTVKKKATEDFAARARTLAERRGEEAAEWAEAAVRDAASATEAEALELGVVDAIAEDPDDLLRALDQLEVEIGGEQKSLNVANADVEEVPKNAAEGLLSLLAHPAVALLLLTIGVNAILIELSSPGGFVAGVVGVLALVLAFYSLGVLEANLIGLAFIGAAFVLFVLELQSPTHGLLALGGILLFVLGAVILFSGGAYGVPWGAILGLAVGTALFFAVVVSAIWRTYRRPPTTGEEALIGAEGRSLVPLAPSGKVMVLGETWDAVLDDSGAAAPEGATVRVVGRDGFVLRVQRLDKP